MSVKERLIKFLAYKKIGQGKFEKAVGLSNGYVNSIKSSIGPEKLQSISRIFTELNIEWLVTGNGTMLKEKKPSFKSVEELNTMALLQVLMEEMAIIKSKIDGRNADDVFSELEQKTKIVAAQILKGK